jgi:phosphodiesterase/alkaline phosphatase D-like protein
MTTSVPGRFRSVVFLLFFLPSTLASSAGLTHAPVAGGVTEHSARFWLHSGRPGVLAVEVSADVSFRESVLSASLNAHAEGKFAGVVEVTGRTPSTRYCYRAVVDGANDSRVGTFTTFPEPGKLTTFPLHLDRVNNAGNDGDSMRA